MRNETLKQVTETAVDWKNLNSYHLPETLGLLIINIERADREIEELTDQLDLHLADTKYINRLAVALNRYALLLNHWITALDYFQGKTE